MSKTNRKAPASESEERQKRRQEKADKKIRHTITKLHHDSRPVSEIIESLSGDEDHALWVGDGW